MKTIALLLNVATLAYGTFWLANEGFESDPIGSAIQVVLIVAPIVNSITILSMSGVGIVSLFLKRKALEEKARIARIESDLARSSADDG